MREGDFIDRYFKPLTGGRAEARGLLDDVAVLPRLANREYVISTDTLVGGVHFSGDEAPEDIAFKAVSVNVSDIVAKGSDATGYFLSLALDEPNRNETWFKAFTSGLAEAQQVYRGLDLLGGDLTRTPGPLAISITAVGHVPEGRAVARAGGQPGDLLFVSGTIGDAHIGLKIGRCEVSHLQISDGDVAYLRQRYERPRARSELGPAIRAHASASMDISDGLVIDAGRMAWASGLSARVRAEAVPLSAAAIQLVADKQFELVDLLTGGDDYEILCAVPQARTEDFLAAARAAGVPAFEIGALEPGNTPVQVVDEAGRSFEISRAGWDHFATHAE